MHHCTEENPFYSYINAYFLIYKNAQINLKYASIFYNSQHDHCITKANFSI